MSRETWANIKNSKSFYIRTYRIGLKGILISLAFNIFCAIAIYYLYFHQPVRAYYATNGETPPVPLNPLDQPNYSTIPLLEADPIEDDSEKAIPQ